MTLKLVITEQAHTDIERNAVWWAEHHSVQQAREWSRAVYRQLEAIPEMPTSHSLSPENPHFSLELREKNVGLGRGGYRAIFTIVNDQVRVFTIRHHSQDALNEADLNQPPA
ncbi:MAG: type II toxin-antitoxin system RelE/ParE family toxin [Planctomycetaceae bacterium]